MVGGNDGTVAAYELAGGRLRVEPGWPASTCSGGQCPEARGMAAADLDGDGARRGRGDDDEHVADRVAGVRLRGVRRAVRAAPAHGRATTRCPAPAATPPSTAIGNHGYGAYGENVGIGQLDDDPQQEVVVTFDNHQINVFNHDGTSVLASPWFRNRQSDHAGARLGWGQFIRWLSPRVERDHYHRHVGEWPDVRETPWLQWTASPPSVADLDRDGRNEVIGLPNVEREEPYETQAYAFMALDGAQRGGARSARRHKGFRTPPLSRKPAVRPDGDWYPPSGIPAPTDREHPRRPPARDRRVDPRRRRLRRRPDRPAALALRLRARDAEDLRLRGRGRRPQPRRPGRARVRRLRRRAANSGRLVVLSASGKRLHDIRLRGQGTNGNGIGVPAAPSIADLDGDRRLEIVLTTFDHGIDVYRVPRSRPNRLPWPTGRGGLLRAG